VEAIVPKVQLSEGWIGITPPPGLLELSQGSDNR
jgi:16S rRNA processing protein RimM